MPPPLPPGQRWSTLANPRIRTDGTHALDDAAMGTTAAAAAPTQAGIKPTAVAKRTLVADCQAPAAPIRVEASRLLPALTSMLDTNGLHMYGQPLSHLVLQCFIFVLTLHGSRPPSPNFLAWLALSGHLSLGTSCLPTLMRPTSLSIEKKMFVAEERGRGHRMHRSPSGKVLRRKGLYKMPRTTLPFPTSSPPSSLSAPLNGFI